MYEDNISGKIADERFGRMSKNYTDEQKDLSERVKILKTELDKTEDKSMSTDHFISIVRKYTRAKKAN